MTPTPELREEVARAVGAVLIPRYEEWHVCELHGDEQRVIADAAIAATLAWVDREWVRVERLDG